MIAAALALLALAPALQPGVGAQRPSADDDRYAGLQWRFVRIKYHYLTEGTQIPQDFAGEPWFIDAPAAEQNLSRRVKTATAIQVEDPIVLPIDDPRLFQYPWIYFVEPGTLKLLDSDVTTLREYFLRGGTAMFDDFHGPLEWDNFEHEMKRVFPNRPIVEVPKDHPVFSAVYKIDGYPAGGRHRLVHAGPHLGEGRLRAAPAHDPRRQRPADDVHQLEHRHGRRLGVVQRGRVPAIRQVHVDGLPDGHQRNRLLADALN